MRRALVPLMLLLAACQFAIDPDVPGAFSCDDSTDCGDGFECIARADGSRSRCWPQGYCVAESCNAADDDCDGATDEDFDLASDMSHCGTCEHACEADELCIAGTCEPTP